VVGRGIAHGSRIVLNSGNASIVRGHSVEAMAVTISRRIGLISLSEVNTGFG
jgi:hypothetical protein